MTSSFGEFAPLEGGAVVDQRHQMGALTVSHFARAASISLWDMPGQPRVACNDFDAAADVFLQAWDAAHVVDTL